MNTSSNLVVSIISVTYNQEKYIKQLLDGFLAQKTDFDLEIIIADDGSKDKTPEIIKSYAEAHPHLIKPILRKNNIGTIANFTDVLKRASGTYIAICEGDDYWTDPKKLQTQVDFLEKHTTYSGCFHRVSVKFESGKRGFIFPEVDDPDWYTTEELLRTNFIPTNSVMYRRVDYSKLADDIMPFDWYFHLYHAQFGSIAFIDKVMSVYRKHESGIWWDYDINRNKLWVKYGLQHLSMLNEILKLYGDNLGYRKIIEESINKMLNTLIDVDKEYETKLLHEALVKYPYKAEPFIIDQKIKLDRSQEEVKRLTADLLKTGDELNEVVAKHGALQQELAEKMKEIEDIKNTRTWRLKTKVDKLRGKTTLYLNNKV